MKNNILKLLKIIFCLFAIAISYNLFSAPINLVAGGPAGLGILFSYLFNIDKSIVIFIVSFIILVLCTLFLDKEEAILALIVTIVFPLAIKLTSNIGAYIHVDINHKLLITLFGAIITGASQGILLNADLNSGGFTLIAKIIYKYTHISVTAVNAFMNVIVVLLGGYFIGIDMMLYAIIYIAVMAFVSERVMLGSSSNKTFKIISDRYEEIQDFIHNELLHDVTLYDTIGSFDGDKRKMIMCIVPTSQFIVLKDFVNSIDKSAFIFVTNTYDVKGQDYTIRKETN